MSSTKTNSIPVLLLVSLCILQLLAPCSRGCEYTVRDIGFVDLGDPSLELRLVLTTKSSLPVSEASQLREWLKAWGIDFQSTVESQLTDAIGQRPLSLVLSDGLGREFSLLEHSDAESADVLSFADLRPLIERHLLTRTIQALRQDMLSSFAQVVVFESLDTSNIDETLDKLEQAKDALSDLLPRPIRLPTSVHRISAEDRKEEALLAWLVGAEDASIEHTVVAVVYGRGKLAGPVMAGDEIAYEELLAQFALVGQSCECQSERKWYDAHFVPLPWDDSNRGDATRKLGFDPYDAAVVAEAKRIRGRDLMRAGSWEALNDEVESLVDTLQMRERDDHLEATVIAGEGWGFEKDPEADQNSVEFVDIPSGKIHSSPTESAEYASLPVSSTGRADHRWPYVWFLAAFAILFVLVFGPRFLSPRRSSSTE